MMAIKGGVGGHISWLADSEIQVAQLHTQAHRGEGNEQTTTKTRENERD